MKGFLVLMVAGFLIHCGAEAGTVRLINNSPYDLRAVVRGSDGSLLGEMIVKAQNGTTWNDVYGQAGTYQGSNVQMQQAYRSKTPYTVLWYCINGGDYGVCDTVATGAVVMAQSCLGARMCKPENKSRYPSYPDPNYLQSEQPQEQGIPNP